MRKGTRSVLSAVFGVLAVLHMVLIFYLSSLSSIAQPGPLEDVPSIDKVEHGAEYFLLAGLLFLSFHFSSSKGIMAQAWQLAMLVSVLFAISDEAHQWFVPGRELDLLDLLVDTAGITVACLVGAWAASAGSLPRTAPSVKLDKAMLDSEE